MLCNGDVVVQVEVVHGDDESDSEKDPRKSPQMPLENLDKNRAILPLSYRGTGHEWASMGGGLPGKRT